MNVISTLTSVGEVHTVESDIRHVFDDVRLVPVLDPAETYAPSSLRNMVVLGRR